jgi:hypothetical protein
VSTTAGIVYAGVPLPLVTDELEGYLRSFLDANTIEWFEPFIGGAKANCFSYAARQPKFELSKLIWPTDLSRFATALFVANATQLDQILAAIDSDTPRVPAQLKIGEKKVSGAWEPIINVEMFLLDPVQVTGTPKGTDALYLIPLVDKRYFLLKGSSEVWDLSAQDTWTSWFATAFNGLGLTSVLGDPIDDAYQKPGKLYYPQANSPLLPLLMDSAAFSVNRRILRKLNGTYHLISVSEAETLWDITEGTQVITGTRSKNLRMVLPETMSFSWYLGDTYDYDVQNLRTWGNNFNWYGVQAFSMRCSLPDGKMAEADALCEKFAEEYLRWRVIRQNLTIPGINRFSMTGAEDRVEFTVNATTALTRVFARHYDFIDSLSFRFGSLTDTQCDACTGGGGSGGDCSPVTSVQCTGGMLVTTYGECP